MKQLSAAESTPESTPLLELRLVGGHLRLREDMTKFLHSSALPDSRRDAKCL